MTMGCFGLGLGRIMAGVVEVSHDKNGIIWPQSLAPYRLCVITDKSPQAVEKAKWICQEIEVSPVHGLDCQLPLISFLSSSSSVGQNRDVPEFKGEVVIDDRDESVGFKLKDALLIGYPQIVVVGK